MRQVLLSFFFFLLLTGQSQGQDLYDLPNSLRYAEHLYLLSHYDEAAAEYERVLFMAPQADSLRYKLLRSYRLSDQSVQGLRSVRSWALKPTGFSRQAAKEYFALLLSADSFSSASDFLSQPNPLTQKEKSEYLLYLTLLQGDWNTVVSYQDSAWVNNEVKTLLTDYTNRPHRSPAVAALLAIVPGLGKVYVGEPIDGASTLLLTGAFGLASWRAFMLKGITSPLGWGLGLVVAGYYIGSIHGSALAAKRFNQRQERILNEKAAQLVWSHFP